MATKLSAEERAEPSKEAAESAPDGPPEPKNEPEKKRPSTRQLVLLTLALLFACEVVARIITYVHERNVDAEYSKYYPPGTYMASFAAKQSYRYINLFTMDPKRGSSDEYHFDEMGFRQDRRRLSFSAKDGFKHIWMFGASTTQGLGLREDETIAAHLNDLLESEHSDWRVLNLGQGAYTSTHELLLLLELLQAGNRPDAILWYDGTNEIPFEGDIAKTGAPDWEKHTGKSAVVRDIQGGETWSALAAFGISRMTKLDDVLVRVAGRMNRAAKTAPAPTEDRGGSSHPGNNWDVVMRRYLVNLNVVHATAKSLGVPVFMYFMSTMEYDDHYKLRRYSEQENGLVAQMANNEYRRRDAFYAPELAAERAKLGDALHDIYDVFKGHDGETLYADPRHPNGAGTKIIAARIFTELKALPPAARPDK